MALNLIKLCVGISSVAHLEEYRATRGVYFKDVDKELHVHRTRMMPRRGAEIVGIGSLYWVIKGAVQCRQSIFALQANTDGEGKSCCDILMLPEIVRTVPQPKRPFQGWRYLEQKDAPADMGLNEHPQNDPELAGELARLGLI